MCHVPDRHAADSESTDRASTPGGNRPGSGVYAEPSGRVRCGWLWSPWLWPAVAVVAVSTADTFFGPFGALAAASEISAVTVSACVILATARSRWRSIALTVLVSLPFLGALFLKAFTEHVSGGLGR